MNTGSTSSSGAATASLEPRGIATAAYRLAGGGSLLIFDLPFVGVLLDLGGALLVLLGAAALAEMVRVGPRAGRLRVAFHLAAGVGVATAVLVLAVVASWFGVALPVDPAPRTVMGWFGAAQVVLGVTGTLLLTHSMSEELRANGEERAAFAWSTAQAATVLLHAPIAVTVLLSAAFGGEAQVGGFLAVVVFLLAICPFAILARAGAITASDLGARGVVGADVARHRAVP